MISKAPTWLNSQQYGEPAEQQERYGKGQQEVYHDRAQVAKQTWHGHSLGGHVLDYAVPV